MAEHRTTFSLHIDLPFGTDGTLFLAEGTGGLVHLATSTTATDVLRLPDDAIGGLDTLLSGR